MGCSICRGHAAQVCGAPGCRDESADVEAETRREEERAKAKPPILACGQCRSPLFQSTNGSWICMIHGVQVSAPR